MGTGNVKDVLALFESSRDGVIGQRLAHNDDESVVGGNLLTTPGMTCLGCSTCNFSTCSYSVVIIQLLVVTLCLVSVACCCSLECALLCVSQW